MFPPFPEEKARTVLSCILEKLDSGEIKIQQIAKISQERQSQGAMLGVLVCKNENSEEIALAALSGNSKKLEPLQSIFFLEKYAFKIIPSIVTAEEIENALSENDFEIHRLTELRESDPEINSKLNELCSESLQKVYDLYKFHCSDGKILSLKEIYHIYNRRNFLPFDRLPPTGIGDCAEPKLLDYAFKNNLTPVSMAMTKINSQTPFSSRLKLESPCDSRCGILLPQMLGLHILYRDEEILVVNKTSGLLSVPGRGPEKQDCIVNRMKRLFPETIEQPSVHRLDMETSGVMVLAFTKEAHRNLSMQFEKGEVEKEYIALLDGVLPKKGIPKTGIMELYFRLDVENRPHQIWDAENGKKAITEWEILNVEKYHAPDGSVRNATRVLFKPHTGRTHQLRLASSDSHGFGVPIIGDTLYGTCGEGERLMLHARKIQFTHPKTGEKMVFEQDSGF